MGYLFYNFLCKLLHSEKPDRPICHYGRLCAKAAKFSPYYNLIKINYNEYKEIIEKRKAKVFGDESYLSLRSTFSTSRGLQVSKISKYK